MDSIPDGLISHLNAGERWNGKRFWTDRNAVKELNGILKACDTIEGKSSD